jgi:hypothetical protein
MLRKLRRDGTHARMFLRRERRVSVDFGSPMPMRDAIAREYSVCRVIRKLAERTNKISQNAFKNINLQQSKAVLLRAAEHDVAPSALGLTTYETAGFRKWLNHKIHHPSRTRSFA